MANAFKAAKAALQGALGGPRDRARGNEKAKIMASYVRRVRAPGCVWWAATMVAYGGCLGVSLCLIIKVDHQCTHWGQPPLAASLGLSVWLLGGCCCAVRADPVLWPAGLPFWQLLLQFQDPVSHFAMPTCGDARR
jgi:hypothetical protein